MGQNKINSGDFIIEMRWMKRHVETTPSGSERKTWKPASVFLAAVESEDNSLENLANQNHELNQRREIFGVVFVTWYSGVSIGEKVEYNGRQYAISKIEPIEQHLFGRYTCKTDGYADSES